MTRYVDSLIIIFYQEMYRSIRIHLFKLWELFKNCYSYSDRDKDKGSKFEDESKRKMARIENL